MFPNCKSNNYYFLFVGRRCQSRFSVCESQPCQNGGACSVSSMSPQGYTCTCQLVSIHLRLGFKRFIAILSIRITLKSKWYVSLGLYWAQL